MVTLFAIPKPFEGETASLQRNALRSWVRLARDVQVLLLGADAGVAEAAAEFGVEHIPGVATNEFGTPLLDSAFELAERSARHAMLAYANADLLLPPSFLPAVEAVRSRTHAFMAVGECYELEIRGDLDGSALDAVWGRTDGTLRGPGWIDYFVFPRGVIGALPPFAVGRPEWDHWLIWRARKLGLSLVDLTESVRVVHQRHGYGHVKAGTGDKWHGVEGERNHALRGPGQGFTINDSTHLLRADGLVAAPRPRLRQRIRIQLQLHDSTARVFPAVSGLYLAIRALLEQ